MEIGKKEMEMEMEKGGEGGVIGTEDRGNKNQLN